MDASGIKLIFAFLRKLFLPEMMLLEWYTYIVIQAQLHTGIKGFDVYLEMFHAAISLIDPQLPKAKGCVYTISVSYAQS